MPSPNDPYGDGICLRTGKRRYPSRSAAKRLAKKSNRREVTSIRGIYKCEFCGYYHTTSQPQRRAA